MVELKGSLRGIGLPAIVQLIGELHHSGNLQLSKGLVHGTLGFEDGRLVAAACGDDVGLTALSRIVQDLADAEFRFVEGLLAGERTLDLGGTDLQRTLVRIASGDTSPAPQPEAPPPGPAALEPDVCPRLGFADDPSRNYSRPTALHRCYASIAPSVITIQEQRELCLGGRYPTCTRFRSASRSFRRPPHVSPPAPADPSIAPPSSGSARPADPQPATDPTFSSTPPPAASTPFTAAAGMPPPPAVGAPLTALADTSPAPGLEIPLTSAVGAPLTPLAGASPAPGATTSVRLAAGMAPTPAAGTPLTAPGDVAPLLSGAGAPTDAASPDVPPGRRSAWGDAGQPPQAPARPGSQPGNPPGMPAGVAARLAAAGQMRLGGGARPESSSADRPGDRAAASSPTTASRSRRITVRSVLLLGSGIVVGMAILALGLFVALPVLNGVPTADPSTSVTKQAFEPISAATGAPTSPAAPASPAVAGARASAVATPPAIPAATKPGPANGAPQPGAASGPAAGQPGAPNQPGAAGQPGIAQPPGVAAQPSGAQPPAGATAQPGAITEPGVAQPPGVAAQPSRPQPPAAATAQPGAATQPGTTALPGTAARQPGTAARQPGTGTQQAGTAAQQPQSSAAGRPLVDVRFASGMPVGWVDSAPYAAWSDGAYRLRAQQAARFVAVGTPVDPAPANVVVSATFRKTGGPPGGGYGLILRDQGPAPRDGINQALNAYVFETGDQGEFGVWRREGDRWIDLVPWTRSAAVRLGGSPNELVVLAQGDRFLFTVNGLDVANLRDQTLVGGSIGIFAGGDYNEVAVDHFAVQALN
jgi:hypothetical protein